MAVNDVTHAEQLTRILDQSQQITIDVIKQDLATLAWGVITVVPGILTLADKLPTLRDGTILPYFDVFYVISILSFLAAIFATMFAYWWTNKKLNAPQGNRQTILKLATIASNAASKGHTTFTPAEQAEWNQSFNELRLFHTLDERQAWQTLQQVFLVVGYVAFAILIIGHRAVIVSH